MIKFYNPILITLFVIYLLFISYYVSAFIEDKDGSITLSKEEVQRAIQNFDALKKDDDNQREIVRKLLEELEKEKSKTCS